MNEFNLIQNLANIMLSNKLIQQQKPVEQNLQNNINQFSQQTKQELLKSTYNQIFEANSMNYLSEFQMDNKAITKYLQSLMQMPKTITKFIQEATNNSSNTNKLIKVIVENMVDLDEVALLLNQNSKEAINKVLKAISISISQGNTNISQLKEVLNVLNTISSTTNLNTNALKELLLLYIPLNIQAFENNYSMGIGPQEEEMVNNSTLTIIFQTLNFANLTCAINELDNSFGINLYVDKIFPLSRFEKILKQVCEKLNINYYLEAKSKKINTPNNNEFQNFRVFSNSKISIQSLLLAHVIIKTIFKFDLSFSA